MSLSRSRPGDEEPVGGLSGATELRRSERTSVVAAGTLACPSCDAPVGLGRPLAPAEPLRCPLCEHAGAVRDFLSLATPTRPARVRVVVSMGRPVVRADRSG